jgi:hypothetical protein
MEKIKNMSGPTSTNRVKDQTNLFFETPAQNNNNNNNNFFFKKKKKKKKRRRSTFNGSC